MTEEIRVIRLPITGMTCAGCAAIVEKGLTGVPGVEEASVNFGTREARVRGAAEGGVDTLVGKVRALGYGVDTETRRFRVEGMHCASCVARVEAEVRDVPGVLSAAVNLAAGELRVTSVGGVVSEPAVADAVARAGYRAGPAVSDAERGEDEARPWRRWFIF